MLLAGGRVSLQHLAEDFLRPVVHADVVEAVAVEILRLDDVVASFEGALEGFFEETAVLVAPIELPLLLLAHRAVAFAIIPTKGVIVIEDLPAFGPGHQGGEVAAALGDVVLRFEVEVAAKATGVFVVAAGEVDEQMPVPVVRHPEPEIRLQHGAEPALEDSHLAILQAHREQRHHPVHLRVGSERCEDDAGSGCATTRRGKAAATGPLRAAASEHRHSVPLPTASSTRSGEDPDWEPTLIRGC